jgi:predicted component of viral defense system (DUF524 family)
LKAFDVLIVKCWGRSGELLGDLEFADSAGEATILADDGAGEISISESSRYALLLRHSADLAARFAPPITGERLGSAGDLFGSLSSHIGLGAFSLGFDDNAGLPLWRRIVRIRPSKFKDAVEFETMVTEICEWKTVLALDVHGRSSAPWTLMELGRERPPEEELAVLRAAADRHRLLEGLTEVARNAQSRLERDDTPARLGAGAIDPSRFALHLAQGGRRSAVPSHHPIRSAAASLPAEAPSSRHVDNHDTPANRFAKFVARSFRDGLDRALRAGIATDAPIALWARTTAAHLDRLLSHAPFPRVGSVVRIDLGDPALQRRRGYRSVLQAYLAARAGLAIQWPELSEIVFAETRDVPQLYELWCLIRLRRAIEEEFGVALSMDHLSGLGGTIVVRRGSVATASAPVTIGGRGYHLKLWYNRTYSPSAAIADGPFAVHVIGSGTWSKPMKPDFSIELSPVDHVADASTWPRFVHLDAKYRLKTLPMTNDDDDLQRTYAADDIDKMHAYLAGISRSWGAHILYPGDRTTFFRRADARAAVGAFAAVPGRMDEFGESLRALLETTFESEETS